MATTRPHIPAFVAAIGAVLVAACGDAQNFSVPSATATASASPTATPAGTTASASAWTVTDRSKATVRVREQLVGVSLPSDAVLSAIGAKGVFELAGDGTFSSASKITFDLTTLSSDEQNRDNFVKQSTLSVRQFPTAEFVPTKTAGLIVPLPSSGTFAFQLTGNMTIRGKTKEVTFDVSATRSGSDLVATATANPTWKFGDFGMTAPSVPLRVLSVTDDIRLSIEVVATGPKG